MKSEMRWFARPAATSFALAVALGAGVTAGGTVPHRSAPAHVIAGYALRMALPAGWDGRVFTHPAPCPCPVLQAANFPLPASDNENGSKALRRMGRANVRMLMVEVGNSPGRRFPPTRLPLRIVDRDFTGRRSGFAPPSHAVADRKFWTAGRSFVLLFDFATKPAPKRLIRQVNRVLATLAIGPTRPLVGEAGWRRLRRPLQLLHGGTNGACPVTRVGRRTPATAFGLGSGPAYAVLGGRGTISLAGDLIRDTAIFHKTLWAIAPSYSGPLLVRGTRTGRAGVVRFQLGGPIRGELRLVPAPFRTRRWRYQPSGTVLPGPGCYALQIDGDSFTDVVVFEATSR